MRCRAVYWILLAGVLQASWPAAAQDFSLEGAPENDPTVKLIDLTGVDPRNYDDEDLTPALIERLHEQQEQQQQGAAPASFAAPEIIYSEPAVPHATRPAPAAPGAASEGVPLARPAPAAGPAAAPGITETVVTGGVRETVRMPAPQPLPNTSSPAAPAVPSAQPSSVRETTPGDWQSLPEGALTPAQREAAEASRPAPVEAAQESAAAAASGTAQPSPSAPAAVPAAAEEARTGAQGAPERAAAASEAPQTPEQPAAKPRAASNPPGEISTYAFADPEPMAYPVQPHPADAQFKAAYKAYTGSKLEELKRLAPQVKDHPLADYVTLWQLVLEADAAADKSVKGKPATAAAAKMSARHAKAFESFVKAHEGDYLAERARTDWARLAARAHDARTFRSLYKNLAWNRSETDLLCWNAYFNLSEGSAGALQQAKVRLLNTSTTGSQGTACRTLAEEVLKRQPSWGWTYAVILTQKKLFTRAREVIDATPQKLLPAPASTLKTILASPSRWYKDNRRKLGTASTQTLLLAALRMATVDVDRAAQIAGAIKTRLSAHTQALLWGRLGYEAAVDLEDTALAYYQKAGAALAQAHSAPITVSGEALQAWQVRAALRAGDAHRALKAIDMLSARQKKDPAWIYWKGRMLIETGRKSQGEQLLRSISRRIDYYGLLACDALGLPYYAPQAELQPDADPGAFARFARNPSLQRAMHFYALELYGYGHREWNWALGSMKNRERLELAQYAAHIGLAHREINTASSAAPAVFTLRYPTPHRREIETATASAGLPEAWVFGLIRQESRFIAGVSSSAGAMGMMQIMPKTGRWVARKIGLKDYKTGDLADMQTNLILGTNYLKMVADSVGGSLPLAASSYNAGPSRAQAWRAALPRTVDGAVFTENIPFGETRNYVMQISANIAAYSRYSSRPMRITDILGEIAPQPADPNPLP